MGFSLAAHFANWVLSVKVTQFALWFGVPFIFGRGTPEPEIPIWQATEDDIRGYGNWRRAISKTPLRSGIYIAGHRIHPGDERPVGKK